MFSKLLRENNKKLRQRIVELEKTCNDLEDVIDDWKERCDRKDFKINELNYRITLLEDEKTKQNNVISNLMEKLNKSNVKNIRQARKIETLDNDDNVSI